jgi:hypothetical protein
VSSGATRGSERTREVEGTNAGADAERLAIAVRVHVPAHVLHRLAHQQSRRPARHLHHLPRRPS